MTNKHVEKYTGLFPEYRNLKELTHGTAMGTKMAVTFANIFMEEIEKQILKKSAHKPLAWKRYIDDIASLWHTSRDVLEKFIEQANKHHPTIKCTAEISCTYATFLDTTIYNFVTTCS